MNGSNNDKFYSMLIMKVKVVQSYPILCNPMDCTVHGILQAKILEWAAVPFSRELPNPGIELGSPSLQVDSLPVELPGKGPVTLKLCLH